MDGPMVGHQHVEGVPSAAVRILNERITEAKQLKIGLIWFMALLMAMMFIGHGVVRFFFSMDGVDVYLGAMPLLTGLGALQLATIYRIQDLEGIRRAFTSERLP